MGIEDVQFLKANASKEEYIAVIDSARRDKSQYPTPQEYVVQFGAPFEHVYGIDIIDVNIPRSGYIIDTYNNKIYFRFDYAGSNRQEYIAGEIPPGNYGTTNATSQEIVDISDLVEAIENTLVDDDGRSMNDPQKRRIRVEIVGAEDSTDAAVITKAFRKNRRIRLKSLYSFAIDVRRSTFRTIIGLSDKSDETNLESTNDLRVGAIVTTADVFQGLTSATELFPVTRDKYLTQTFVQFVTTGPLNQLEFRFGQIGTPPVQSQGFITIRLEEQLVSGNNVTFLTVFEINIPYASLVQNTTVVLNGNNVQYAGQSVTIKRDVKYWLYIYDPVNTDINNCWAIRHGQLLDQVNENIMYKFELGETVPYYDPMHAFSMVLSILSTGQVVSPSGIIDLFGERYIQLRCPEIEEHLHRSRAYEKYNVGLAIIPTSLEYRNLSEKFVLLPSRSFHPIGRLKRMTFRFETASGELYNFNGIDHTVTIVVRYYKVNEVQQLDSYVQNPNYRLNYLDYVHENGFRDRSDSDEDDVEEAYPWTPWP